MIFSHTDFTLFVSFEKSFLVGLSLASNEEPTLPHPAGLSPSDVSSGGRKFVTAAVPGVDDRLCALEYTLELAVICLGVISMTTCL